MKLSTLVSAGAIAVSSAAAADSSEVQFLTAFVGDFQSNKKDYLGFIKTAENVPPQLTSLAIKVATYKDDSYTTLLDNSQVNVPQLMSFATELPWYSRIEAEAGISAKGSSTKDHSSSSASSSSSSSKGAGASMIAPAGAVLGAAALLLL
ncbi:hypothetical protein EJF18_70025 [Clavispora lusitaniae]|uniref:Uncharacterized protein n=3 Tax=Clavispora lusitaniae TaxID=36911 RepID=C4YBJ0_CLAL4|nr:uncharacterized protein CLUG_05568 [Clavispora lusitaniae ATCC 42720]KAF5209037.1 hypothetical protein E0198_004951 [Clavispora lusitaniae]EEQ41440.1 hypothetical protein CLUG_05568 [Clavispora lusitaniae ATCC 42720]KAF7581075.1 Seripauperin and TIP1 family protein [Clavispora lusitaniae]OVF06921.1 hypothetical protein A9F13_16g00132 [Clavispora lusitaniae]QFZ29964.1 hypothetical protein EJF14_70025 [Clavispora lusitaniae]